MVALIVIASILGYMIGIVLTWRYTFIKILDGDYRRTRNGYGDYWSDSMWHAVLGGFGLSIVWPIAGIVYPIGRWIFGPTPTEKVESKKEELARLEKEVAKIEKEYEL